MSLGFLNCSGFMSVVTSNSNLLRLMILLTLSFAVALNYHTLEASAYVNIGCINLLNCEHSPCIHGVTDLFLHAIHKHPSHNAYRMLGLSKLFSEQPEEAIRWLERASELNARECLATYWKGKALEEQGKYHQALLNMEKSGYQGYFHNTAMRYWRTQQHYDLIALSREATKLNIEPYFAYYSIGMSYLVLDEQDQAVSAFKNAVFVAGANSGAWAFFELGKLLYDSDPELAQKYFKQGRSRASEGGFGQVAFRPPKEDYYWYKIGEIYLAGGDLKIASEWAEDMVESFPGSHLGYDLLGRLAFVQGDVTGSIEYFEIAVGNSTSEANPWTRLRLGRAYLEQNKPALAIEQLSIGLSQTKRMNIHIWGLHFYLAEAYIKARQCELAREAHSWAKKLAGNSAQVRKVEDQQVRMHRECGQ